MMLDLQENITKVRSATAALRRDLVDEAVREYFAALDVVGSPAASDFEAAEARANAVLRQALLSDKSMAAIDGSAKLEEDALAAVALGFETIAQPVRIGGPAFIAEAKALTLALAAAGGALVGMLVLAPLLRLAFEMQDVGLLVGGPAGALVFVLLVHQLGRLRFLTRILPWLFARSRPFRGAVRRGHEKTVRACIEQWVDWAVSMLAVLCFHRSAPAPVRTDSDRALRRIGKLIYSLHGAPADALPVVAHELIQEAKNTGFENLEGAPRFLQGAGAETETLLWRPDLQGKYETFGHVTEGDPVTVERPAVIFGGRVIQRGLVRRVRDKT